MTRGVNQYKDVRPSAVDARTTLRRLRHARALHANNRRTIALAGGMATLLSGVIPAVAGVMRLGGLAHLDRARVDGLAGGSLALCLAAAIATIWLAYAQTIRIAGIELRMEMERSLAAVRGETRPREE